MSESGDLRAKKAWETRKKKERHDSYLKRTKWIKDRAIFLKKYLDVWKKESGENSHNCVVCGESMVNTLHIHHLDGDHTNNKAENLTPLCGSCHIIIHKAKSDEDALRDFEERHKRISHA
jgi:5-methylcytosine-specific restriction endonuclease McrA